MKTKAIIFFFAFTCLIVADAAAIRPPDNSTTSQVKLKDTIRASMSNVDDIGLVIVWNGDGAETVLRCQWTSGGNHGSDSGDLGRYPRECARGCSVA